MFSYFFFHAFISSCFYFFRCFRVFSLLIAFFHFTVSSLFVRYFVFVLLYRKCYGFERAFFNLRRFLPSTPSQHLVQPAFIKASQRPAVQPWRLQDLPRRFETQTLPIFLFESYSVQQKELVGRFCLCIRGCYRLLYQPLSLVLNSLY